jgi:hypothetical protein
VSALRVGHFVFQQSRHFGTGSILLLSLHPTTPVRRRITFHLPFSCSISYSISTGYPSPKAIIKLTTARFPSLLHSPTPMKTAGLPVSRCINNRFETTISLQLTILFPDGATRFRYSGPRQTISNSAGRLSTAHCSAATIAPFSDVPLRPQQLLVRNNISQAVPIACHFIFMGQVCV